MHIVMYPWIHTHPWMCVPLNAHNFCTLQATHPWVSCVPLGWGILVLQLWGRAEGPHLEKNWCCCGAGPKARHRDPILIVYTVYCTEYSKNTEIKIYTEKISILRTSVYTVGYTPEYSEYSTFPIKSSIFWLLNCLLKTTIHSNATFRSVGIRTGSHCTGIACTVDQSTGPDILLDILFFILYTPIFK